MLRVWTILLPLPLEKPFTKAEDPEAVQAYVVPDTLEVRAMPVLCPEHKGCPLGLNCRLGVG